MTRNTGANGSNDEIIVQQNRFDALTSDYKKHLSTVEEENASQCSDMTLTQGKLMHTQHSSVSKKSIRESFQKLSAHQQTAFMITEEPDEHECHEQSSFGEKLDKQKNEELRLKQASNRVNIKIEEPSPKHQTPSHQYQIPEALTTTMANSKREQTSSMMHSSQYEPTIHGGPSSSMAQYA